MSEHNPQVEWYGKTIFLNEKYLLYFSDQKREMTAKELAEYRNVKQMPDKLQWRMLLTMDPRNNPNVRELTGRQIITAADVANHIPVFDKFFDDPKTPTRRLTLLPADGMEYYIQRRAAESRGGA